ncbi:hypothetical protein PENNAL_c0027G00493 [Penicillium nalgiovense]|uniref:Cytochrome P450 n=1 Tax=Penicillium nalgiovense TaxID=60175 RepID=A0A1V6Y9P2_PENNA|nr:hypothetical protein PENNAL_c0027G00493 [Penicillium nalgiovense]
MCRLSMTAALSADRRNISTITIQPGATGQMNPSLTILLACIGIPIVLLARLCQIRKLRTLERLHGCEKLSDESDNFRYDVFAFADFDSSPLRKPMFEPITPHGIFTLDGADWKRSREQLRNRLSNLRKVIDLGLCEQHFQAFLRHVPPNGQVFDIQRCTPALALNMQTRFSLGESVDALDFTQSQEKKQFVDDLDVIKERIFEEISQFADQAMSILLANDSMSTTLSGLFYCLSRDERIVKKFRTSIVDAIGLTPPTWSQLRMLHYVRWVLQEACKVMRVFPAVVFNARVANKHSTMPSGGGADGQSPVLVRKGDIVVFSTWARHRLGKDLGESPEKFYPERWEHLNSDMPGFIPFNRGPRICAGRQYAMTVLTYIVARIFQTFSNVSNYNTKEWTERISMTFENENGVLVGLS